MHITLHKLATTFSLLALLAMTTTGCKATLAQPELGAAEAAKLQTFPFDDFHQLLQAHVDDQGRADYTAIKADPAALNGYTAVLATVGPSTYPALLPTPEHTFAYYINGYNALAMLNALNRYPGLTSLSDIVTDFFYFTEVKIDGDTINLYDLENSVIRPMMRKHYVDKGQGTKFGRVHFALNCASASCPKLPNEAFTPDRIEAQLERETRRFVSETRNVTVNDDTRTVTLSRIFDWYKDDFTNDAGEPINPLTWINMYRPEDKQLDASYTIAFYEYDWTLNDQKLAAAAAP